MSIENKKFITEKLKNTKECPHEKNNDKYITLGNFAKLANISRDTLAFYYKKGLIEPAFIGQNGYKYFLPEQVQTTNYIKYLRKCDMPLENIKMVLADPSYEKIQEAFVSQQKHLVEKMEQLRQASCFIDRLNDILNYIESKELDFPYLEELSSEEMYLTPVRFCHSLNHETNAKLISDFLDFESNSFPDHLMCCMIPQHIVEKDDFCSYMRDSMKTAGNTAVPELLSRPAGLYACLVHEGGSGTIKDTVTTLTAYINKSDCQITGDIYIINSASYINLTKSSNSKYLIQIPVKKR